MYCSWWNFWLVDCCLYVDCFQLFFLSPVVDCGVVDWGFLLVLSLWPSCVGIGWGRNLWTLLSVMNVHVGRFLFPMAFRIVLVVGLPMDRCRKVGVSFMLPSGIIVLICGSYFGMDGWGLGTFGNLHSLVDVSLYPVKILRPPFDTCACCFVNFTSHTLSHRTVTETRGSCIFLNIYAFFVLSGSPSIFIWHWMCASILFLSIIFALIGFICWS